MSLLAEIARTEGDDSPFVNYVVVPSFAGSNLTERTCPHFDQWLASVSVKCPSPARSWIYDHGIQLDCLESWDRYCTTGDELLEQLLVLQQKLCDDETIILIGHKLGCYLLKKALITAWNNGHKDEYRQVLDMVETIMLVGEPSLNPKKPDEWIELISECISRKKGLPKRLATGFTVGCLQQISDKFEEILLFSTVFDVSSSKKSGLRRRFRMKRMEHDGCIGCATVHVRLFTTSSEETLLESGPGDASICPFHPKSIHFPHLLTLTPASPAGLPQIEASGRSNAVLGASRRLAAISSGEAAQDTSSQVLPPVSPVSGSSVDEESPLITLPDPEHPTPSSPNKVEEIVESHFGQGNDTLEVIPQTEAEKTGPVSVLVDDDEPTVSPVDQSHQIHDDTPYESSSGASTSNSGITLTSAGHLETLQPIALANPADEQVGESHRPRKEYYSSFIPPRDDLFYGRTEILKLLEEALLCPKTEVASSQTSLSEPRKPNLVCLIGMAGIGKTSIANEFAYRFMNKFKVIIWLNASSEANLGKYCHDSAVALGLVNGRLSQDHAASRLTLMKFLKDSCSPWLLVLDDCEEGVDISQYIPNDGTCSVLATARYQPLTHSAMLWTVLEVPGFTVEEGARFLLNCLNTEITDEEARAICSMAVRYHISPLSCRHLASWRTRESISLKDISVMLGLEDISLARRFESPIYTITYSRMGRLNSPASSLLGKLCFYDGSRVKERHVRAGKSRTLTILARTRPGSSETVTDASTVLFKLALVDIDESRPERAFCLHRSVQDAVRSQLDDEAWRDGFHEACGSILYSWPSPRKFKNILGGFWEEFDDLHSHVNHLAVCLVRDRLAESAAPFDPGEEFMRLLVHHTWYNSRRGNRMEDWSLHDLVHFLITTIRKPESRGTRRTLPRRWLQVLDDEEGFTTRLVDTSGLDDSPYIALSYQWGAAENITPSNFNNDACIHFPGHGTLDLSVFPQQISDAITFTRNMGYKYIWIDSICMDQTNPTELSEELSRMTDIYTNSAMIFCALEHGAQGRGQPSTSARFKLRWQPSQRLDISSYSILRSVKSRESSSGGLPAVESQWRRVFSEREHCLLPFSNGSENNESLWNIRIASLPDDNGTSSGPTPSESKDPASAPSASESLTSTRLESKSPSSSKTNSRSVARATNIKKPQKRSIFKGRYGALRHNKKPIVPTAKRQKDELWKARVIRWIDMIAALFAIISNFIDQTYGVLVRGVKAVIKLDNKNPQLRTYFFALLLVVLSVCIGNCMPRFVLV
ncbi:hypothetical protein V8F20_008162 [Naviculisporaceae sp. PSN 640]